MKVLNAILNFIFPAKCIICQKTGEDLCLNCLSSFNICHKENPSWVYSIYDYQDINVKKTIKNLKYRYKKNLSQTISLALENLIIEELSDLKILKNFKEPILIPIPLSKQRQKERGYNQSLLICENLIKSNPKLFYLEKNILIKHKETKHQADIKNKKERLQNLAGSFSVKNKDKIKNKNIILIDDVTTTGATLKEAKKVLKENGAKHIIAFTFAH